MLKPIERNPRPANPVRSDTDPEFQAAVQRALAARATAEGRPPESHGYETAGQVQPGDALERLVGPDGVPNNGQFRDPNLIHPGDVYFQQGKSPVSAQTEGVIDTALAYDRKNGANAPDSQRNWDAVQTAIAGELRQTVQLDAKGQIPLDANGQLQLTADQQAKLQALNGWAVGTDRLSLETQQALTQVDGELQQKSRTTLLDQNIAAVEANLKQVNHKLDDQSFVRKGWGWITPGKSSGEEFRDFLQGKLDDLKEMKADDTGLPQAQYDQKLTAVLGNFDEQFQHYSDEMADSDKTWDTIGQVGRVVAATTVGIVTTAATGGNATLGFAAAFGTYELIDAAGDISAVAKGEDMYADGHSSIIGFGMDAAGWDGDKGDGTGVSWDHTKAALKDTAIDGLSSITTAGATTAGMKVSTAVGTRLAGTALPGLASRSIATAAGATTGQVVNGTGQLASDATRLAFDNNLFTAEGGQQMLNSAKTQGIYLATAPVTGAVAGAIPMQRIVTPAADDLAGAAGNTRSGASQAAQQANYVRISKLGVAAQLTNDTASNLGGAELVAQLTGGHHMTKDDAIAAVMGTVPGTAMNVAMRPGTPAAIQERKDLLAQNGGVRTKETQPGLGRTQTWIENKIGEVRVGAQVRLLGSADMVMDGMGAGNVTLGQPTVASTGGAISTKTNYRAISQSVVDSVISGSLAPIRMTLGQELTISQRPHEYRNITLKEAGASPISDQTVFQAKGSDFLKAGEKIIFATDPAQVPANFVLTPRSAKLGETTADGTYVDLAWGLQLPEPKPATLKPGERTVLGETGVDVVRMPADVVFTKLMEEQKVGVRPRMLSALMPGLKHLPRLGFERRPEDNITLSFREGDKISRQVWDQMQGTYRTATFRTRFVVDDETKAMMLAADPKLETIRDLVTSHAIDPATKDSYVPKRESGLRLSAVTGKPAEERVKLPGGWKYRWHRDATNLDFIFNDRFPTERIPGLPDSVRAPDQVVSDLLYKGQKAVQGEGGTPHRVRAAPLDENMYRNLAGPRSSHVAEDTRYTVSYKLPPLPIPKTPGINYPGAFSLEFRAQWKRNAPGKPEMPRGISRAVRDSDTVQRGYLGEGGTYKQLEVPEWLDSVLGWQKGDGRAVLFPEGGAAEMRDYLSWLKNDPTATPQQREQVATFERDVMPDIANEKLMRQPTADAIRSLLEGQAKPVGTSSAPENPMPLWNQRRQAGGTP